MKAISIRQPWCFLILENIKDHENRNWSSHFTGPVLIHASKTIDHSCGIIRLDVWRTYEVAIPKPEELTLGAIVGRAMFQRQVKLSSSPWFTGPFAWPVFSAERCEAFPFRGMPGLFDVPDNVVNRLKWRNAE